MRIERILFDRGARLLRDIGRVFAPPVLVLMQPAFKHAVGRHDHAGLAVDRSVDHIVEQAEALVALDQCVEIERAIFFHRL